MKIYVLERDCPNTRPDPSVFHRGEEAMLAMKTEYEEMMHELGTDQETADEGLGAYGCYYECAADSLTGSASIISDYDVDRWEWRVTAHEVR